MDGTEERERVVRWLEESQYVIGRLLPGMLDDRERLRAKLAATETDLAKLRQEVSELRKQVADLHGETQYFRNEHTAIADAVGNVLQHIGQIQKPLTEASRRLHIGHSAGTTDSAS